jgi:S-adenosylmethionine hydrolase
MSIVTLLTDFGTEDAYVGIVKGVILSVNPGARIVDVTHAIAPGDVSRAAYLLETTYGYFPPGTVHMVVVDPGVGSARRIIALEMDGHRFLAPDNGVLSAVLAKGKAVHAVSVENSEFFLSPLSRTFHGRDVFAPVAARLAGGMDITVLGPVMTCPDLVSIHISEPVFTEAPGIIGSVISVDRFGNLITNIRDRDLSRLLGRIEPGELAIRIRGQTIEGLSDTYGAVAFGEPLAVTGSTGRLEISINGGSAVQTFNAGPGEMVRVEKL